MTHNAPRELDDALPPTYVRDDASDAASTASAGTRPTEPQIVILPITDAVRFQQGFLGADGEHASIEGELQIKSADEAVWSKVCVRLRIISARFIPPSNLHKSG
jgi:hypothetical protein